MKKVSLLDVKEKIKQAVQDANFIIDPDLKKLVSDYLVKEESPAGKEILQQILQNADIACNEKLALCQDTGLTVVFVEQGAEVIVGPAEQSGRTIIDAINEGVASGYERGYLRKSIVVDPLKHRMNTGTNAPAVIHLATVPGPELLFEKGPKAQSG